MRSSGAAIYLVITALYTSCGAESESSKRTEPTPETQSPAQEAPKNDSPPQQEQSAPEKELVVIIDDHRAAPPPLVDQVSGILERYRCQGCHSSASLDLRQFPFASSHFATQEEIVTAILDRVTRDGMGKMPPSPDQTLSDQEVAAIDRWLAEGLPIEGAQVSPCADVGTIEVRITELGVVSGQLDGCRWQGTLRGLEPSTAYAVEIKAMDADAEMLAEANVMLDGSGDDAIELTLTMH